MDLGPKHLFGVAENMRTTRETPLLFKFKNRKPRQRKSIYSIYIFFIDTVINEQPSNAQAFVTV